MLKIVCQIVLRANAICLRQNYKRKAQKRLHYNGYCFIIDARFSHGRSVLLEIFDPNFRVTHLLRSDLYDYDHRKQLISYT